MSDPLSRPFRHPSGRIDWQQVARLLGMGCGLHEAALVVGCPVDQIRRNLRRSRRFRFWIDDHLAATRAKARVQFRQVVGRAAADPAVTQATARSGRMAVAPNRAGRRAPAKTGSELAENGTKLAFSRTELA